MLGWDFPLIAAHAIPGSWICQLAFASTNGLEMEVILKNCPTAAIKVTTCRDRLAIRPIFLEHNFLLPRR